jgi:hypothetical protein
MSRVGKLKFGEGETGLCLSPLLTYVVCDVGKQLQHILRRQLL